MIDFGRLVLTFGLALLPAGAMAQNGWDVFEVRCLTPIAKTGVADVIGLPRGGAAMGAEHFDADKLALMETYAASDEVTVVIQPKVAADYPGCLVLADDVARAGWQASEAWLNTALAAGTWEQKCGSILGPHYVNTDVQQPNLRFVRLEVPKMTRVIFGVSILDAEG